MLKIYSISIKLIIAVIVIFSINVFGQDAQLQIELKKSFKKFDVVRINNQDAMRSVTTQKSLKLVTSEKIYALELERRDLRSRRSRAEDTSANGVRNLPREEAKTYKGYLKGETESKARFTISEKNIEGYFVSNGEMFFVEPARRYSKNAENSDLVIYKKGDHLNENDLECNSDFEEKISVGKDLLSQKRDANLTVGGVIELATEADFQFVQLFSSDPNPANAANEDILGILNMTEGVYEEQFDLTIEVVFQHTWSTIDPLSGTNAQTLNKSFQNYWNANYPTSLIHRDAAHLFTAKSYSMSQGYAYIGSICSNPTAAYGLSGRINPEWNWHFGDFLVTTHEIAHNLNANHTTGQAGQEGCGNQVMITSLGGGTELSFCQFSQNEVGNFVSANGSCLAPPANLSSARFDFDGDSKTDTAIYRPTLGQWWYLRSSDGGNRAFQFGTESDKMAPADYTGDGLVDITFWRESTGEWFILRSEDSSFYGFPFGTVGDIPAPGDFDGDGIADIAVFRPSNTTWYILNSSGSTRIQSFGASGDIPVVNDYDGDGSDDLAIYRPDVQQWWINKSSEGVTAIQFGSPEDIPAPADYTGDGKTDVGIFRPSTGEWYISRSEDSSFYAAPFGTNGDIPVPGDYDGDGTDDLAVWRPSTQVWYLLGSQNGISIVGFGTSGDIPVPASFIP